MAEKSLVLPGLLDQHRAGVNLPGAGREEAGNKCDAPLSPGSDVGTSVMLGG